MDKRVSMLIAFVLILQMVALTEGAVLPNSVQDTGNMYIIGMNFIKIPIPLSGYYNHMNEYGNMNYAQFTNVGFTSATSGWSVGSGGGSDGGSPPG